MSHGLELSGGEALSVLFERAGLPRFDVLPEPLLALYGGTLGFTRPRLFANFVASLDGVVALSAGGESGQIISGKSEADRFVMGLLRACADAVIVGASTFRRSSQHLWHAEAIYPKAAPWFAETRRRLGLAPKPKLVLVTASGAIDPGAPAVGDALIVTCRRGEGRLRATALPQGAEIAVLGSDGVNPAELVALLHARGSELLLTEGGPTLFSALLQACVVDELFLTSSPKLFGRFADDGRKSLADGRDLGGAALALASVKRHGSHLFLRYMVERPQAERQT
jgi:riboflavin biosynthesis pyrimidine reductase